MASVKSSLKMNVSVTGPRPAAPEKTALPRQEKPAKAPTRRISKSLRPRLVEAAAPASAPGVILWDDPVEPAGDSKPKG